MRQDRRLNGWVLIGSIIGIICALALIVTGVALGVSGFVFADKLLKIKDLQFFIYQEGIIEAQLSLFKNQLLKTEFLYLALAIIVGVAGLLTLIFTIVGLNYAKKRKVVRHRVALLVFALIPLAIMGCALTYLLLEFDAITNNIKYILYGVIGAFGFVGLCNILGVMFGRSEKFMSNDNNKYAFDNSTLRNARIDVNNNIRTAENQRTGLIQAKIANTPQEKLRQAQNPRQPMSQLPIQRAQSPIQPNRPAQPNRPIQQVGHPTQQAVCPMQQMGQATARPVHPMQNNGNAPRPITPNTMQSRPMQSAQRPVASNGNAQLPPNAMRPRHYCQKCGKLLVSGERICGLCGHKVTE